MRLKINIILSSTIFTILVFSISWVYGATFFEDEYGVSSQAARDQILQYCRFIGYTDGEEDIKSDLVDTGKVSTFYTDWTCDEVQEEDERINKLDKDLSNMFQDLDAMAEMERDNGK